jgi:hypothetical protein
MIRKEREKRGGVCAKWIRRSAPYERGGPGIAGRTHPRRPRIRQHTLSIIKMISSIQVVYHTPKIK